MTFNNRTKISGICSDRNLSMSDIGIKRDVFFFLYFFSVSGRVCVFGEGGINLLFD